MKQWLFDYHDEEENELKEPEKKTESDLLTKVWDFIFDPHRDKPETPKKAKQIKKDQPKKEEVKQDDRPEIKQESPRGKYRITERSYYTDEPPETQQRPVKPDNTTAPEVTGPTPEGTGASPATPENEPDANQADSPESKPDDVTPV